MKKRYDEIMNITNGKNKKPAHKLVFSAPFLEMLHDSTTYFTVS